MNFFSNIFRDEFVIDEPREEVCTTKNGKNGSGVGESDLLTAIADTMVENERLVMFARQLERSKSSDEELFKIAKKLLPTLDGFERVLELARSHPLHDEMHNWLKSVESIYFKIFNTLGSFGLTPMQVIGKRVNLDYHEVVDYRSTDEQPEETIIDERQKGYFFRGKILRDAKVIVAQNKRS